MGNRRLLSAIFAVMMTFVSIFAFTGSAVNTQGIGLFLKGSDEDTSRKDAAREIKRALDKYAESVELKADVDVKDIAPIFYEVLMENSQYYYVSSQITYTYSVKTNRIHTVNFTYNMDRSQVRKTRSEFNNAFKAYVTGVDKKWTDMQKCLAVHDMLIANCRYDTTVQKESYTAYGALVKGAAVCQGYSIAYAQIMNEIGIECKVMYSAADNHMWNCVKLGTNWYNVDCTYDDPLPDSENQAYHKFFLKSKSALNSDGRHNIKAEEMPVKTDSKFYDHFFWNNVTNIMPIDGDNIYYVTKSGEISCYSVSKNRSGVIYKINDIWKIPGTNSYYEGIFSSCALCKENLYFNTSDSVFSFATADERVKKEKTVSIADGCLYGVKVEGGAVYGLKKSGPSNSMESKWEKILDSGK